MIHPPAAAHVASFAPLATRLESDWTLHKEADFSTGVQSEDGRPGILVVDDDQGIRENIADLLGMEDYRVVVGADANEAMDRLAAEDVTSC